MRHYVGYAEAVPSYSSPPIEHCGSDYGRLVRSTFILSRCPQDPDYEIAALCKLPEYQKPKKGGYALGFIVVRQRVLK